MGPKGVWSEQGSFLVCVLVIPPSTRGESPAWDFILQDWVVPLSQFSTLCSEQLVHLKI